MRSAVFSRKSLAISYGSAAGCLVRQARFTLPREAPSSVSHRAMAMNGNGESGAAAPAAARTGKGGVSSAPGASRRVEPYPTAAETMDPPPGLFVAAFESGSPLLDAERQRRARPEVAPVAMTAMAMTPPARPSAPVTPPMAMEPPSAGCSTEDLRLYVLQVVKQQDAHARDTTDLEMRIAVQLNGITRDIGELGKESQAVKRDVGVFEAIKHLVTESALDARTRCACSLVIVACRKLAFRKSAP